MLRIIKSLIKQYVYWLLVFAFVRLLFLLVYSYTIWLEEISLFELLTTFYYALKLDIATASYFLIIPFFILFFQTLFSPQWLNGLNKIYIGFILFVFILINTIEFGLYAEWRSKLSYKAFSYLEHLDEIANTAQTGQSIILLLLLVGLTAGGIYLYIRYFYTPILRIKIKPINSILFLLIGPTLMTVIARGGLQEIPINQSQSYFSKHLILNNAATNSAFNLFISVIENTKNFNKNPFIEMPFEEAEPIIKQLFLPKSDSIPKILTLEKPNIVLLILESWSADLIETLGGEPGITPFFHSLEKDGLLFDNVYASGPRSEQSMAAIFSGFPAHPISSITVQPDKYKGLPSWVHLLNERGYDTSFYFGGQLIYGNIKSFIMYNAFDRVKEVYDFSDDLPHGKLGIHDEFALSEMADDLNMVKEPFLSALFTLSSHSPYNQPKPDKEVLPWGDNERQYINSAYYTDQSLKKFFKKAKQSSWYKNTLFIIVADHSHNSYRNHDMQESDYHKIPLLFYGEALKPEFHGKINKHMGYQPDLAATLLPQLNLDATEFPWSKNLLDSATSEFAYTAYEEGFTWLRPAGEISYEKRLNYYYVNTVPESQFDSISKEGKAFLQVLFQDYMDR
ncbi:MAG: sulfatase-like hydrolase/transferase [Bacteroidales bacterium]|jgi:phosphoglycerol transferase MdoB-like AlkP superfamily enzyme|nr:sulfatase-like hydrolase/transferase [Bacteroidales bacterium]